MDVVFSVCIVMRGAVGARVWEVSVFRHADVVSRVHPVAVLNSAFCLTQFVDAGQGLKRYIFLCISPTRPPKGVSKVWVDQT